MLNNTKAIYIVIVDVRKQT